MLKAVIISFAVFFFAFAESNKSRLGVVDEVEDTPNTETIEEEVLEKNEVDQSLNQEAQKQIQQNFMKNLSKEDTEKIQKLMKEMQQTTPKERKEKILKTVFSSDSKELDSLLSVVLLPYKNASLSEIESSLIAGKLGAPEFFSSSPKTRLLAAKILKDKSIILSMAQIPKKRKMILFYAVFMFFTFWLSWKIKKKNLKDEKSFFLSIVSFLKRTAFLTSLRLIVFYILFKDDLSPFLKAFSESFF